jgi:hypothetical protein
MLSSSVRGRQMPATDANRTKPGYDASLMVIALGLHDTKLPGLGGRERKGLETYKGDLMMGEIQARAIAQRR